MAPKSLNQQENFVFGPFVLDGVRGTLRRDGELVNLSPKVFETLRLLVAERGEVVSKAYLMDSLWPDSFVEERSLSQNIFLLRRTLGKTTTGADYIETLSKRGYRISVPVECGFIADPMPEANHVAESAPTEILAEQAPIADPPKSSFSWSGRFWSGRWLSAGVALAAILCLCWYLVVSRSVPTLLHVVKLSNDGIYKNFLAGLHTDGTRVYFSESIDQKTMLARVDITGGETLRQPGPFADAVAFDYASQSNEVLFGAIWEQPPERPLTAMAMATGAFRTVGNLSAHGASWSPDGKLIAYVSGKGLYVARNDGSDARLLTHTEDIPFWPRWSPDGRRIRFSQNESGQGMTLWEIEADGQHLQRLFATETFGRNACCGDWSPDGRYYAFAVDQAQRSSLWVVRDQPAFWEHAQPVRLADGPMDFWRSPVFAPDGRHILALGEQSRGESVKFDPKARTFRPFAGSLNADTIAFSRDGKWMAYTSYPEGILWRSRVDGTDRLQLTTGPEISRFPQWSPDGSQLVYIAARGGNSWKIRRISANGGQSEVLLDDGSSQGVATWSPDGRSLAFGDVIVFGVANQDRKQIRILDLTTHTASALPGSEGLWTARWSPDGRYLCALTLDNRKLMLYDFSTRQWTQLTDIGINDVIWSLDSRSLYFDSSDQASIYRVDMSDRRVSAFASLEGIRRTGFFGTELSIAPDNNLILLQDGGAQEVYRLDVDLP